MLNDILTLHKTVTSKPIRLFTNFITLIPSITVTELRVVSMGHLQRVWHASTERLPFQTLDSVPILDLLMLQLLRPAFPNLSCLFSTFNHEYLSVLSQFCLTKIFSMIELIFYVSGQMSTVKITIDKYRTV